MTRADAEALGWSFDLSAGMAYKRATSGHVLSVQASGDQPLFSLLANIAEKEGVGFAQGYGGDQEITPELVNDPPTLDLDLGSFIDRVAAIVQGGPISTADLFVFAILCRRKFGRVDELLDTAREAFEDLQEWRANVLAPGVSALDARVDALEEGLDALTEAFTELAPRVVTLENQLASGIVRVTDLEAQVNRAAVVTDVPAQAPKGALIYHDPTNTLYVGHGAGVQPTPV